MGEKNWRLTKEQYNHEKAKFLETEQEDEMNWSLRPQKPNEIILRTLLTLDPNVEGHHITFTYVCRCSKLIPELIDDMAYLQSGLFDFKKWIWNDDVVDKIMELLKMQKNDYIAEFLQIVDGDFDFPEIYDIAKHKVKWFKRDIEKAKEMKQPDKDMKVAATDVITVAEMILDTKEDYTKLLVECYKLYSMQMKWKKGRGGGPLKRIVHNKRMIRDRMDWDAIYEYQDLPVWYKKKRKSFFKEERNEGNQSQIYVSGRLLGNIQQQQRSL